MPLAPFLRTKLVIWGAKPRVNRKDAFAQLYGHLAKNQADGMEPIITAFLEGTL